MVAWRGNGGRGEASERGGGISPPTHPTRWMLVTSGGIYFPKGEDAQKADDFILDLC